MVMHHQNITSRPGFTLVEILVVVVILGFAAMIVVPQVSNAGTLTIQAAARRIIADLLVAQNEAIARGLPRAVVFDAENERYRLTDEAGTTVEMSWMNGPYLVDFIADTRFQGVTIAAASFAGSGTVTFDDLGTPSSGGTIDLISGTTRYRITVAPFTGRVTVAPISEGI
jgi:type II secretion system protein H